MFKKAYLKIGLVVLLLITAFTVFGVFFAQAANTDYCTLKVTFPTECESVTLSINAGTATELESGKTYPIPKSAAITLMITPKDGYQVVGMFSEDGETQYNLSENNTTYAPSAFAADASLVIRCTSHQFDLIYLPAAEGDYSISATKPTTHIYKQDTEIPIPQLAGYKFKSWMLLTSKDATEGTELLPDTGANGETVAKIPVSYYNKVDVLYLKPIWVPNSYPVYRYDYVFNPDVPNHIGTFLDVVTWESAMGSTVSGKDGGDTHYKGYYFDSENELYYTSKTVTVDETQAGYNEIYRFYLPNQYPLTFTSGIEDLELDFGTETAPTKFIFNEELQIPNPKRDGYNFVGWTVTLTVDGKTVTKTISSSAQLDYTVIAAADNNFAADKDTTISFAAIWSAKVYNVSIDYAMPNTESGSASYPYDKGVSIPNPTRTGYTFIGWKVNGVDCPIDVSQNQTLTLQPYSYTSDISLVAQWKANTYTVTIDGNNADSVGTATVEVTYDAPFALPTDPAFVFPKRTGYEFVGFSLDKEGRTMYTDANGVVLAEYPIWNIAENTTLYAQWAINQYEVVINIEHATKENTSITVINKNTDQSFDYWDYSSEDPLLFDYGTKLEIAVTVGGDGKLVKWNGEAISHTKSFTYSVESLGAGTLTLSGVILSGINAPEFQIDYNKEIIIAQNNTLPDGHYLITCGGETLDVYVTSGKVTVNGGPQDTEIDVPESFFGKTISIITYGVDGESADSDPQTIAVAARPAKPEMGKEIESVYQDEDTSIVIQLNTSEDINDYEFAYSESNDGTNLTWKSASQLKSPKAGAVMFEGLKPGANYYIYIRVKAESGQHAHGLENCIPQVTKSDTTLDAIKRNLLALIQDTDGDMVQSLIDKAIEDANALERPAPDFYTNLEAIYNRVLAEIVFAREQDTKIAALAQLHKTLVDSGEFSTNGVNTLNTIYGIGVESIKNATASDDVQKAYNKAVADMKAVLVTHLVYGDMELTAYNGLPQGTKLFQSRYESITNLINSVDAAIQAGNISVGGAQMTLAEATEALRTLDVMAAYQMKLTDGSVAFTAFDGTYEIRLLLPAELRGVSGLQVAYYNEKTGELEVLDTEKDGNCLVFQSTRIADFVILGDPTMNLNGFIGALLVILICQLIGIILLLVRRGKSVKNHARHYSLMLPMLLTIRFLPDNGLAIVLVLGILVILFQIILMYLLLTSDVIYHRKRKKDTHAYRDEHTDEAVPTMAQADETAPAEDVQPDEAEAPAVFLNGQEMTEEESYEDAEEPYGEDGVAGDGYAVSDADDDALSVFSEHDEEIPEEEFAEVDTEDEAYDDFIEPAANPRYSLPDEDEMYVDTETGELYSTEDIAQAEAEGVRFTYDDGEEPLSDDDGDESADAAAWQEESAQWQYDDTDAPEQTVDGEAVDAYAENEPEADAEETAQETDAEPEYTESAFYYEEPDARGDEAPAPDDFYYDPEEDNNKKYDGYEE